MTLQVDLAKLAGASKSLHGMGDEASGLSALDGIPVEMSLPFGNASAGMLSSAIEASNMALGVQGSLIPAVSGRLTEIGDLMHAVTVQFRESEEADVPELATTYTMSSGHWASPPL